MHRFHSLFIALFVTFISLTACATGFNRLVVFGDSLSDVGTYAVKGTTEGGGKFTTNPGAIWIENIAQALKLEIKPHVHEGFGQPGEIVGGFNYAQGGSRLVFKNGDGSRLTAKPIVEQIGSFLIDNHEFKETDLVVIQGGANDVTNLLLQFKAKKITAVEAVAQATQAAEDFSVMLHNIKNSNGKNLLVVNLPAIEKTPTVLAQDLATQKAVADMVMAFNEKLSAKMNGVDFLLIDINSFDKNFNNKYRDYGFINVTEPACKLAQLPGRSSLFCTPDALVSPKADQTYKFADGQHPTTGFSKVVSDYILIQIKNKFKL